MLRPEQPEDDAFLRALYASTRQRELNQLSGWSRQQISQFIDSQFDAQHSHYLQHYPTAQFLVLEQAGQRIGRLYVDIVESSVRLMDLALVPAVRNRGLGGALTRAVMDYAESLRMGVTLHVEEDNPAKRLYDRLGFVVVGELSFYKKMAWSPDRVR